MRQNSKCAGFTLVEILVVVLILGIAGAIIVPQLSRRDDRRAEAAARALIADLIYTQNLAITQQGNFFLVFQLTPSAQYSVQRGSDMSVIQHPVNKTPYTVVFGPGGTTGMEECTLASAVFQGPTISNASTLGFDELGTPIVYEGGSSEAMTSGAIVIQSGTYRIRIDIEPYTGQISVTPI